MRMRTWFATRPPDRLRQHVAAPAALCWKLIESAEADSSDGTPTRTARACREAYVTVRVCGKRWYAARGSGDPDPATLPTTQRAALFLGKAAPDTGVLCGVESPLQARLANRAQCTNGF